MKSYFYELPYCEIGGGGGGKSLSHAEGGGGGGGGGTTSFGIVFAIVKGGAQKVVPCLERGVQKVSDPRFSHVVAPPSLRN